jgi:hypothetical protein
MSKPDQRAPVTIEDLLRLKRAERPSAEFWTNFEHELRQKQLTALVQKRRWWHELSVLVSRRIYMPAGAAAVIAFTLVAVRYSAPTQIANTASIINAADPAIETLTTTVITTSEEDRLDTNNNESVVVAAESHRANPAASAASPETEIDVTREASLVLASREVEETVSRPASLTRLEQSASDLADPVMGSRLSSPARVQAPNGAQSELAAMTNASASKYRLIARYVDRALSPAPSVPAVVRDRLARRLGDDLGDDISRVGVVGGRVSLKF